MLDKKCLVQTESLEYVLKIKNVLDNNGIKFTERTKVGNGWGEFLSLLFVSGRGSYGSNSEHVQRYSIYVEQEDFEKASALISGI